MTYGLKLTLLCSAFLACNSCYAEAMEELVVCEEQDVLFLNSFTCL